MVDYGRYTSYVIDLRCAYDIYCSTAPDKLTHNVSFCDYVDIVINTHPTPSYIESVMDKLVHKLLSKKSITDEIELEQYMGELEEYTTSYSYYISLLVESTLGNYGVSVDDYRVYEWIDTCTAVLATNSSLDLNSVAMCVS